MITKRLPSIYFYPQNCVDQNIRSSDTSSGSTFDTIIHIEKQHLTLIKRSNMPDNMTLNYCAAMQSMRHPARIDRKATRTLRTLARVLFHQARVQLTRASSIFTLIFSLVTKWSLRLTYDNVVLINQFTQTKLKVLKTKETETG